MVKVEDDGVVFPAVHARVLSKVVEQVLEIALSMPRLQRGDT